MAESTRESGADESVPGRSVRRRIVSVAEDATAAAELAERRRMEAEVLARESDAAKASASEN